MTTLPIWFLVLSLFLPRIALIAAYISGDAFPHLMTKWLSVPMAFFIPRVLVLIAIATIMGICPWFWIHLAVLFILWGANSIRYISKQK